MQQKGYIHLYTGNGQGKTTAAFGLAVRALGAGKKVFTGQFVKSIKYNEVTLEQHYSGILIKQYGLRCFLDCTPAESDIRAAENGWKECCRILAEGTYDLVILDELTIALYYKLLPLPAVLEGLAARNPATEVVITGRYAPQELIETADLVTEMQEIKHYYRQGVLSRDGFDR